MSRGKYSPWCYGSDQSSIDYAFNCYGEVPVDWNKEDYDEKTMCSHYDSDGFDRYGYSAFDIDGNYIGVGQGIDRYGYMENEYLCMTDDKFESVSAYATELTEFNRIRDTCLTQNETLKSTPKGCDMNLQVSQKKKRKTAAEKRQEQQAEQDAANAADWELFKKEYPVKFAALIFDFLRFNTTDYSIDIVRTENNYEFCWGTEWNRNRVDLLPVPPENYDWLYLQSFRDAEQAIENEREKLRDAERKELLKQTALAKLSKEERKVLGL